MPADLKAVSAIFTQCIDAIREEKLDYKKLEKEAVEVLKQQRYDLMRQIEAEYYKLERSVGNPSQQPFYAINPHSPLTIYTPRSIPHTLEPYMGLMRDNLQELMLRCGFSESDCRITSRPAKDDLLFTMGYFWIDIKFPAKLTDGKKSTKAHSKYRFPKKLTVDDSFENANLGARFKQILDGDDGDEYPPPSVSPTPGPSIEEVQEEENDVQVNRRSTRSRSTTAQTSASIRTRSSTASGRIVRSRSITSNPSTALGRSVPPSTRSSSRVTTRNTRSSSRATSIKTEAQSIVISDSESESVDEEDNSDGDETWTKIRNPKGRAGPLRSSGRSAKRARR